MFPQDINWTVSWADLLISWIKGAVVEAQNQGERFLGGGVAPHVVTQLLGQVVKVPAKKCKKITLFAGKVLF